MPIAIGSQTLTNGGTARFNNKDLTEIKFREQQVWKKETTETGTLTVVGNSEDPNNVTYENGWYEKSFDIPVGTTFRLNYFKFESNGTPIFSKVEIYANGTRVKTKNSGQDYAWNSGALPSATGTYTSTTATNTLRLRATIAINNGIFTGKYSKAFLWSVYQS